MFTLYTLFFIIFKIYIFLNTHSVKKIINDWNIDYEDRNILPIIEEGGVVKAIYGAVFGKKNWYVVGS